MYFKVCKFWVLHILLLFSAWYVPAKYSYQGRTWYITRHVKEKAWLALIVGILAWLATEGLHLLFTYYMQFVWLSVKMTGRINNRSNISSGDAFQKFLSTQWVFESLYGILVNKIPLLHSKKDFSLVWENAFLITKPYFHEFRGILKVNDNFWKISISHYYSPSLPFVS